MFIGAMERINLHPTMIVGEGPSLLATYEFGCDISAVHPYLHAAVTGLRRRAKPLYARFSWREKFCILYRTWGGAGHFYHREEAEDFGRAFLQFLEDTYRTRNTIVPDDPDQMPPRAVDILKTLPLTNCRKCGAMTCLAFAVGVSRGEVNPWNCPSFPQPDQGRLQFVVPGEGGARQFALDLKFPKGSRPGRGDAEVSGAVREAAELMGIEELTTRELEVLELMALGFTNREIAQTLHISPHTVKTHADHIFTKLDVTDRTQASMRASRAGLI